MHLWIRSESDEEGKDGMRTSKHTEAQITTGAETSGSRVGHECGVSKRCTYVEMQVFGASGVVEV